jgi:ATP-dependent DNA ligase
MGLEALVCKHRESLHRGGRSDRWVKVKTGGIQQRAVRQLVE